MTSSKLQQDQLLLSRVYKCIKMMIQSQLDNTKYVCKWGLKHFEKKMLKVQRSIPIPDSNTDPLRSV